jgi:hypothetical protein
LKDFTDTSLKVIKTGNTYISYNELDGEYFLCFHELRGPKSSFLMERHNVKLKEGPKTLHLKILSSNNSSVTFSLL